MTMPTFRHYRVGRKMPVNCSWAWCIIPMVWDGTKRRLATAKRHIDNFGIATECGFGRRSSETLPELMRIHRETAKLL